MTTHHNLRNSGFSPRASYIIEDRAAQGDSHAAFVMRIAEPVAAPAPVKDALAILWLFGAFHIALAAIWLFKL